MMQDAIANPAERMWERRITQWIKMNDSHQNDVDIKHIAQLARLDLSETEINRFQGEIEAILSYARLLSDVDLTNVEPTAHATSIYNIFRDDVIGSTLDRNDVLANAPEVLDDEHIKVPVVIGNTGDTST